MVTRDASSLQRSLTWSRAAASAHRRSWRLPEHYFYQDNLSDQVLFVARLSCSTEHDCPVLNASTTRWPSAPNPRAISSPMPRLAPVTSTAGHVSGVTADCTSARLRGASHPMIGVDETLHRPHPAARRSVQDWLRTPTWDSVDWCVRCRQTTYDPANSPGACRAAVTPVARGLRVFRNHDDVFLGGKKFSPKNSIAVSLCKAITRG